jgi:hypothetical protein
MSDPLVIGFNDFKKLSDNKRIYYFVGESNYEFNLVSDGLIVKTSVKKAEIEDPKQFFSDKMFYNAMELKYKIPNPKSGLNDVETPTIPFIIQDIQDHEVKNIDIQPEGVE